MCTERFAGCAVPISPLALRGIQAGVVQIYLPHRLHSDSLPQGARKKRRPSGALKKTAIAAVREVKGLSVPVHHQASGKAISSITHFLPTTLNALLVCYDSSFNDAYSLGKPQHEQIRSHHCGRHQDRTGQGSCWTRSEGGIGHHRLELHRKAQGSEFVVLALGGELLGASDMSVAQARPRPI